MSGVGHLQQPQINGRGSEQAVSGNCCMHMHKRIKGGAPPCICSKQTSLLWKVGVAHEANIAVVAVVVLPDRASSILHLTWSNPGQTRIIFKPGAQLGFNADLYNIDTQCCSIKTTAVAGIWSAHSLNTENNPTAVGKIKIQIFAETATFFSRLEQWLVVGDTSTKISIPILECLILQYQVLFFDNRKF